MALAESGLFKQTCVVFGWKSEGKFCHVEKIL